MIYLLAQRLKPYTNLPFNNTTTLLSHPRVVACFGDRPNFVKGVGVAVNEPATVWHIFLGCY